MHLLFKSESEQSYYFVNFQKPLTPMTTLVSMASKIRAPHLFISSRSTVNSVLATLYQYGGTRYSHLQTERACLFIKYSPERWSVPAETPKSFPNSCRRVSGSNPQPLVRPGRRTGRSVLSHCSVSLHHIWGNQLFQYADIHNVVTMMLTPYFTLRAYCDGDNRRAPPSCLSDHEEPPWGKSHASASDGS